MAWLEKRGDAFRLIFRLRGRKFTRSLKTRSERAAEASLARIEDNIRRVELGTLEVPDDVDVLTFLLSDGRVEKRPTLPAIVSLKNLFDTYFASIPDGALEQSTLKGMKMHIKHLYRHLDRHHPCTGLQLLHLQSYIERRSHDKGRRGRKVSPATLKKEIVTLRTAWNWARNAGILEKLFPGRGLKYPKGSEKPPFQTVAEIEARIRRGGLKPEQEAELWESAFLTLDDVRDLLAHVRNHRVSQVSYPLFVFAAHTGARRSECVRTTIDDVDFASGTVVIHERKRVRGRHSTRRVPMSPTLVETLKRWLVDHPGGRLLFCRTEEAHREGRLLRIGEPLDNDLSNRLFKSAVAKSRFARLPGWHVFRHSFCSNCAAKGIDQRVINAWVGHQTEEMVKRYRHLIPNQQQEAIRLVFAG